MRRCAEQHTERRAQRLIEAQKRMRRETGEERLRAFVAKRNASDHFRGRKGNQPEAAEQQRMARPKVNRTKHFGRQVGPAFDKRLQELPPRSAVGTQRGFRVA